VDFGTGWAKMEEKGQGSGTGTAGKG